MSSRISLQKLRLTGNLGAFKLIAMFTLLALSAAAGDRRAFTVVRPTGVFPDDVQNVQAAVDKGGTVLLRAFSAAGVPTAFNFGTDVQTAGNVLLTTDVEIIGETGSKTFGTTINGGFTPFLGFVPVKSRISGIDFENPISSAITILASSGSEITGNRVHNVVPVKVQVPSGDILTFADGIDFFGETPQDITGRVRLSNNVVDGLGANFSNGTQFDTVGADSEITDNTFLNINCSRFGGGVTVVRSQHLVFVRDNLVDSGPGQVGGWGIFIGSEQSAVYKVTQNKVNVQGPFSDGIDVSSAGSSGTTGAVISGNQFALHNGSSVPAFSGGIVLIDSVTDSLIEENRVRGDGFAALLVTNDGLTPDVASGNRFIENDIDHFSASAADVFLDVNAQNNLVAGECTSVIDLGAGNAVFCGDDRSDSVREAVTSIGRASVVAAAASIAHARKLQLVQMFPFLRHAQPTQ